MKRRILHPIGEAELEVLQAVWQMGEATVGQVHERILTRREVAYTTIMTLMKRLTDKGYLSYQNHGNTYHYQAQVTSEAFKASMASEVVEKIFDGSPMALVQTLFKQESFSEEERAEIEALLDQIRAHTNP